MEVSLHEAGASVGLVEVARWFARNTVTDRAVEYGRIISVATKAHTQRWLYIPLSGLLLAVVAGQAQWFSIGITALILPAQGCVLIGKFLIQSLVGARLRSLPSIACACSPFSFLPEACSRCRFANCLL